MTLRVSTDNSSGCVCNRRATRVIALSRTSMCESIVAIAATATRCSARSGSSVSGWRSIASMRSQSPRPPSAIAWRSPASDGGSPMPAQHTKAASISFAPANVSGVTQQP